MKSKSVTNLAEATADPALEAAGNPVPPVVADPPFLGSEMEEGAVGGVIPPHPSANEPYPEVQLPPEDIP